MSKVQTDNSHFEVKVKIRLDNLPTGEINVLEGFGGDGLLWKEVKKRSPDRKIRVLRIDRKKDCKGIYLVGDNSKFLPAIDFSLFKIIDLDAYGVPYAQLRAIFERKRTGALIIHVTFIQTLYGCLPRPFLQELGYTEKMVKRCPSLFNRNGFEKLKRYLAINGVRKIERYSDQAGRKNYICFKI